MHSADTSNRKDNDRMKDRNKKSQPDYEIKPVIWKVECGCRIPFCPYCGEPAYDEHKCCFCGKEYKMEK